MNIELIYKALVEIQNVCICSKDNVYAAMQTLKLLISTEDGLSIYSHEFLNYLKEKYSMEITNDELNSVLPEVVERLGTHIEPMVTLSEPPQSRYKIFLT